MNNNVEFEKTFFTANEIADRYRIHRNTIYKLVTRGKIKAYKIGGQLRFILKDLEIMSPK